MEEYKFYDKVSKRKKAYKDAIVFEGVDIKINIYDKIKELENNNKQEVLQSNNYAGMLRFEIVWKKSKLQKIKKKYIQYNFLSHLLADIHIHSRNEIRKCVKTLFKHGRYIRLKDAGELLSMYVHDGNIKERTKDNMLKFMHLVSIKRSYAEAAKECPNYKYLEKKFKKLNINPVTIPVRRNTVLPSIYEMLGFDDDKRNDEMNKKLKEIEYESQTLVKEYYKKIYGCREIYSIDDLLRNLGLTH